MWNIMWLGLWFSSIVFTIYSFNTHSTGRNIFFPLLAAVFWFSTSLSMTELQFVQMGSVNIDIYNHALGDWAGEVGIMWLFHGAGVLMLIFALYNGLRGSAHDLGELSGEYNVGVEDSG